MQLKWIIRNEHEPTEIDNFARQLNVSPIIAHILFNRGIKDFETARDFFRADINDLHDPFLMHDMEKAVDRLIRALKNKEKIMLYGDYDVDGVTSVAMTMSVLRREFGYNPDFYIPDRLREGYGLSQNGIQEAQKKGVSLIISVDCGITAHQEIALANEYGIDVIVADHHEASAQLPAAFAILDPKRPEETYPFAELAGVGVTYKLLQGLFIKMNRDPAELKKYIEFVALGSAADIVPLVDENRIFVRLGLQAFNDNENVGLQALLNAAGLKNQPLTTGQVVFIIAPRINAVGRMGNAERAVNLLTTENPQQAQTIASVLEAENRRRKAIDEQTFEEALVTIESEYDLENDRAFVLDKIGWHPGVIGIVASRVVEKYYRPTILIAVDDGIGKGSARSIPGFDLYRALKECDELMLGFGGHKYAAGLSIRFENIEAFRRRFLDVANERLAEEMLIPKLRIDSEIRLSQIDAKFIRILKQFAPFGPQNMRPIFVARKLEVVGTPAIVGKNHLKFKVRQDGVVMDAIGFSLGDLKYRLAPAEKNLDMAFVIDENDWQGFTTIQLRVKDLI